MSQQQPALPEFNKVQESADPSLTQNLTGGQIQTVLDSLILQAAKPIILNSQAFDIQIAYVLSIASRNKKRKLSALPREEAVNKMCLYLLTKDFRYKAQLLSELKLERGFIYNFVVKFLNETSGYKDLYYRHLIEGDDHKLELIERKMRSIEASVGFSRDTLFTTLDTCRDYLFLTYEFRNNIVMHYLKHSFKQAKAFVKMKGSNFNFEDVYQNFLTAVTKAIDKYDSSKGALTSYINYWIMNVQTTSNSVHGHEYGIAYTIPQVQKKALTQRNSSGEFNFSVSLDKMVGKDGEETELIEYIPGDGPAEKVLEEQQELDVIRYLAKCADTKRGLARLYLDIDETYSQKELRLMVESMQKQGLEHLIDKRVLSAVKARKKIPTS